MPRDTPIRYVQATDWNDENVAILREGVAAGYSYGQIAARIPYCTRSAAIGKASRMGLERPMKPSAPKVKRDPPRVRPSTPQQYGGLTVRLRNGRTNSPLKLAGMGTVFAEPADPRVPRFQVIESAFDPLPGSSPKPWTERLSGMCCWPVGLEGNDALSCCEPVHGRGWCLAHFQRGVQPASVKTRVDVRVGKEVARAVA